MIGNFAAVSNFNRLFLKLTGSSVTNCQFSRNIGENLQYVLGIDASDWEEQNGGRGESEATWGLMDVINFTNPTSNMVSISMIGERRQLITDEPVS